MGFDLFLFNLIYGVSHKTAILDFLGVFFAEYAPYILILFFIYILLKISDWQKKFYLFSLGSLSVILSRGIVTELIRFIYARPRPFLILNVDPLLSREMTGSFPSGHATAYYALALVILYFIYDYPGVVNKKWNCVFLGTTLMMGIARIFCGIHWPTDIIGGFLIAWASVFLVRKFLPKPNFNSQTRDN